MKPFQEIFNKFMILDQLMKTQLFSLLVLVGVTIMPLTLFPTLEMAYSQHPHNPLT
jgi:hypothetical protein